AADKAWMGWFGMKSLLGAIEMAKSTEGPKVAEALEKWRVRDGDLDVGYRDFDHQMVRRTLVCQVKPKITDKWDYFDVAANLPRATGDLEKAFGNKSNTA